MQTHGNFHYECREELPDIFKLSILTVNPIKENLNLIYSNLESGDFTNKTIEKIFNDFPEEYIREQFFLTQKNNQPFGKSFTMLLVDFLLSVILIITGVLLMSLKFNECYKMYCTNIFVSGFIITIIDAMKNVFKSIRKEIIVSDFYET